MTKRDVADIQGIIAESLGQLRASYRKASSSAEENTLSFLGVEFFVDQIRHLAIPSLQVWKNHAIREGRATVTNEMVVGLYTPPQRVMRVNDFVRTLEEMVRGDDDTFQNEDNLGHFLGLMVIGPTHDPSVEIGTWLTIAHALANGDEDANIFELLPQQPGADNQTRERDDATWKELSDALAIPAADLEAGPFVRGLLDPVDDEAESQATRVVRTAIVDYVRTHILARLTAV